MRSAAAAAALLAASLSLCLPAAARADDDDTAPARHWHDQIANAKDAPCRSNAACAAAGVVALSKGRFADAGKLVDTELMLAVADFMMADTPARRDAGVARIAMAFVHRGDIEAQQQRFVAARAWYRIALDQRWRTATSPGVPGASTQRVFGVAGERLAAIATRDVVAGLPASGATYRAPTWAGPSNDVPLAPVKGRPGVYRLNTEFLYPTLPSDGELSANLGDLDANVRFFDGVARIPVALAPGNDDSAPIDATRRIADTAPYAKDGRCLIELRLSEPETLTIKTIGDETACGFGHNVSADGIYRLTDTHAK